DRFRPQEGLMKNKGQHSYRLKARSRTSTLTRRDLFRIGMAAGFAASMGAGALPGLAPRRAYARVGTNTEGIAPPSIEALRGIARRYFLRVSDQDLATYGELMKGTIGSYRRIAQLQEPRLPVKYPRAPGYRPSPEDNRLNAWYWRCSIKGADSGILKGKR